MALAPRTVQNIPELFEAGSDHGFASGFDHARTDEEVLAAELGIAHALGIPLKVVGLGADLFRDFGIAGRDGAERGHELFDFSLVQQALLVELHPGFLLSFVVGVQLARQVPQMLASVVEIDNLHGAGKVLGRPDSKSIRPHRP